MISLYYYLGFCYEHSRADIAEVSFPILPRGHMGRNHGDASIIQRFEFVFLTMAHHLQA